MSRTSLRRGVLAALLVAGAVVLAIVAWPRRRAAAPPEGDGAQAAGAPAPIPPPREGTGSVRGRLLPAGLKGDVLIVAGPRLVGASPIAPDGTFLIPDLPPGRHRLNYRLAWKDRLWLVEVHDEGVPEGRPSEAARAGVEVALRSVQAAFAGKDAVALLANYSPKYDDRLGTPLAVVRAFHEEALSGRGPMKDLSREAWLMDVAGTDDHPVASVKLRFRFRNPDGEASERINDFLIHLAREGGAWRVTGERKLLTGSMNGIGPEVETRVRVGGADGVIEVKAGEVLERPDFDLGPVFEAKRLQG